MRAMPPAPGRGREPSPEEEDGVPPTDTTGAGALGVGESSHRRGEDMIDHDGKERGRANLPQTGESDRPAGTSTPADATGVDP